MDINTSIELNNGINIPLLGLGTYLTKAGNETLNAVRYALDIGYRHIDTAALYANEKDVGIAVKQSKLAREEIFITTKVWNSEHGFNKTIKAFDESLRKLDSDYIDLYLVHWPVPELRGDTWKALEKIYSEGKAKSIGVSNYTIHHLDELLKSCKIIPSVNQVELSPFLQQPELMQYCKEKGIIVEAYSPLTRGKKFNDKRLKDLANKYSKTSAQIMIRWALQYDTVVLPKSARPERIKENADVFDFEISDEDMEYMKSFDEGFRIAWDPSDLN
ncbi:MAG: glyoxal reductase [Ignavibacteria bacterium GWB2_35_12]|nr:MAG: glyoxal reductase [Ignavibacteria bacterium GWA2_35_8]OGU39937.1 MAG: glyoxal reductase [Ignavibacteria bacterium GWB2_35_12]OGU91446.1 MAG: glyoxal reductase [Ignavibacteria bacterium RIFOXYA2_FULL_35_10]OGV22232.1 MAG: glyoxal reductase [Ignavibacteria bacterium RIFOXYC2_FULL_35_21]